MVDRETVLVNHVLESIRKDLDFLKQQQYLSPQAYAEIQRHLNVRPPGAAAGSPGSTYSPAPPRATGMPSPASNAAVPPPPDYKTATGLGTAEALYDFTGPNPQDLSFRRGDIIQITEYVNDDWWRGSLHGNTGLFPSNYVKKIPQPPPAQEKGSLPPPPPPPSSGYGGAYPPPPPAGGSGGGYHQQPPSASPYGGGYPPPPAQSGSYAPLPSNTYATPPAQSAPAAAAPAESSSSHDESGLSSMLKKVGGNVANAATWGFGGTLGSEAAHALF